MIAKYPDYPIVILADEDSWDGDHASTYCSSISFSIDEILDAEAPPREDIVYTDRIEFEEDFADWLYDKMSGPDCEPSNEEFEARL